MNTLDSTIGNTPLAKIQRMADRGIGYSSLCDVLSATGDCRYFDETRCVNLDPASG